MSKPLLTTLLLGLLYQLSCAQTDFDKVRLDSFFTTLEANDKFMGSVAVSKNGTILYKRAIGFADVEQELKANPDTKYRIGSITKTFTAVLVFKAIEQGKLHLDDSIDRWFPTIQNAAEITVEHLLGHHSGIHNFTDSEEYFHYNTQPKTEAQLVEIISRGGSDFQPGTQAAYSNSNYVLLTLILEKILDLSYSEMLEEYITKPLGLSNTYVFGQINTQNNEAKSYTYTGGWEEEAETHFSVPLGAGAITSTPTDLIRFADALFRGELVQPEHLQKMMTISDGFGMGLFQFPFYQRVCYGHTGGIDGFSSVFFHIPADTVSYALTSNGTNINNNDISVAVLSALYGLSYDIPVYTRYETTAEDLDQYLGRYSSAEIPLKISITKRSGTLMAQATNQPAFPLEATAKHEFQYYQAAAKFTFNPAENSMILHQNGQTIQFVKEP